MAGRVTVKIEGGKELLERLKQLGISVDQVLEAAVTAGAKVIAAEANTLAPDALIRTETAERGKGQVTVDIGPPDEKWYWRYLETGAGPHSITGQPLAFEGEAGLIVAWAVDHPGMAKKPFLRPALDARTDQATDEVGKVIRDRALK